MFEIEKSFSFEAGHTLSHHDGKCIKPHGHSYTVTVKLRGEKLQESGSKKNMLVDFHDVAANMRPLLENYLDHHWLNDTLQTDSPTAEWIAQWIFRELASKLPQLVSVTVQETATAKATYTV